MSQLFVAPFVTALDSNANAVSGAKLYFYASGTTTLQTVYQDADLTVPHASPVLADSAGRFAPIYLDTTLTYRMKMFDASDNLIKDVDPVNLSPVADLIDANGNVVVNVTEAQDARFELKTDSGAGLERGISVLHYADTVGSYGVDIHQYQGAKAALVIHCYSDENGAIAGAVAAQIDHTRTGNILVLKNAENPVTSPGTRGTANFLNFVGYGGSPQTTAKELGGINHQLKFYSTDSLYPFTFTSGLQVVGTSSDASALKSTSVTDTYYGAEIYGTGKGLFVSTTNDTGFALSVNKTGTGSTAAAQISNAGTGRSLSIVNAALTEKFGVDKDGLVYVQNVKVLGTQGGAITDATVAAGATPTKAEFDALVGKVNSILAAIRASTGHGLIA